MVDILFQGLRKYEPFVVSVKEGVFKTKNKMLACKHISKFIKQLFRKDLDAVVKITLNEAYNTARKKME
jgi:predicted AAA+ superfamily ATPase